MMFGIGILVGLFIAVWISAIIAQYITEENGEDKE